MATLCPTCKADCDDTGRCPSCDLREQTRVVARQPSAIWWLQRLHRLMRLKQNPSLNEAGHRLVNGAIYTAYCDLVEAASMEGPPANDVLAAAKEAVAQLKDWRSK